MFYAMRTHATAWRRWWLFTLIFALLGATTPPEVPWDSGYFQMYLAGNSIVTGALAASVTAFDCRRFLKPSWNQLLHSTPRGHLVVVSIAAWSAIGWTIATCIVLLAAPLASAALGSTPQWRWPALLNSLPWVWFGCGCGLLFARFVRHVVVAPLAGIVVFAAFGVTAVNHAWLPRLRPLADSGLRSGSPIDIDTMLGAALWVSVITVTGFAVWLLGKRTPRVVIIFSLAYAGLASSLWWVGTHDIPSASSSMSQQYVCIGSSPEVCVPKGTEGYASKLQRQLQESKHVLDEMQVKMPERYIMLWNDPDKSPHPLSPNAGHINGAPESRSGHHNLDELAAVLASPAVSRTCYESSDANVDPTQESFENGMADTKSWTALEYWIAHKLGDPGASTLDRQNLADSKQVYENIYNCGQGKS